MDALSVPNVMRLVARLKDDDEVPRNGERGAGPSASVKSQVKALSTAKIAPTTPITPASTRNTIVATSHFVTAVVS